MTAKQKEKPIPWIIVTAFIVFVAGAVYLVKAVLTEDAPRKRDATATVTLLKPPPPVQIKEKPPELQQPKETPQEQIIDPGPRNESPNQSADDTPAGDSLGVDAEGGAGSDGFGLVGKKGGRSLLAGGGGGGFGKISLLNKFGGYAQIVQTEVKKKVMKRLDEEGGIPKGNLQAVVRLSMDNDGKIIDYRIIGSSGNNRMDDAVIQALRSFSISEPPPDGMPRTMDIKISSRG